MPDGQKIAGRMPDQATERIPRIRVAVRSRTPRRAVRDMTSLCLCQLPIFYTVLRASGVNPASERFDCIIISKPNDGPCQEKQHAGWFPWSNICEVSFLHGDPSVGDFVANWILLYSIVSRGKGLDRYHGSCPVPFGRCLDSPCSSPFRSGIICLFRCPLRDNMVIETWHTQQPADRNVRQRVEAPV